MAAGTKFRTLARLLDASEAPVWVIGTSGKLVYLSGGVSTWLGIDAESLLDRRSVAGAPISDDPLDFIAASMSPPPGFTDRGTASLMVHPPPLDGRKITPLDVRFVRIGARGSAITIAIAGDFVRDDPPSDLRDAVAVRQCLDRWRARHATLATIATAGTSQAAHRLRGRLHLAGSLRTHVAFFGPPGSGAESIASRIHALSAPGEPLVCIEGPLMDAELLDASVVPLISQLTGSADAQSTVLVRDLDEMPIEAAARLADLLTTFKGRLRLLALCGIKPKLLSEPLEEEIDNDSLTGGEPTPGIIPALLEYVSAFTVPIPSLSSRVEDIPVLASAMVDARHAAGEGVAERISRAALDSLVLYPWPRNFAELDDAVRQAIRMSTGDTIAVEHLPLAIRSFHVGESTFVSKTPRTSLDEALKQLELKMIDEALEQAGGNRAEAARQLGISRARLLRRIEESEGAGGNA